MGDYVILNIALFLIRNTTYYIYKAAFLKINHKYKQLTILVFVQQNWDSRWPTSEKSKLNYGLHLTH